MFTCPSGFHFNKAVEHCEKAKDADCVQTLVDLTSSRGDLKLSETPNESSLTPTTEKSQQLSLNQLAPNVTISQLLDIIQTVGGVDNLQKQLKLQQDIGKVFLDSQTNLGL